jgi:two-component system, NarL family, response regulator DevR
VVGVLVGHRIRSERERTDQLATLSGQERIVFGLIGEGLTNRQIGEQMSLTEKTVKNYVWRHNSPFRTG